MVDWFKIRTLINSYSIEINGLGQFQGQFVEITIAPITATEPELISTPNFMRFYGIASDEIALLEAIEQHVDANRALDLNRSNDLWKKYYSIPIFCPTSLKVTSNLRSASNNIADIIKG